MRSPMAACCPHPDEDHQILAMCEEVIHYPSEDYPCLCEGFTGSSETCERCQHARDRHVTVRVCRPSSGEFCSCRT